VGRRERAAAVAVAAECLAASSGVRLPDSLRLWSLAGVRPAPTAAGDGAGVDDLAAALEAATDAGQRRAKGLHVTPGWVADHLVARALALDVGAGGVGSVCDPACGGGVFLVAAARALHAAGVPKGEVVRERIWGADIDPVGLAAAEAALALWSGGEVPPPGRLVVGDPLRRGASLWRGRPPGGFHVVVGNPPFQSQLGRATARARAHQSRLRDRFGDAVRPYTDTAWLFLLLGCQLVRPGGRVVLVQPDSLVAARDAAAVRDAVDRAAELLDLWVDDRQVFAAAVRVCAPVLRVRPARPSVDGDGDRGDGGGGTARWHDLLADATGVPAVELDPSVGRVGDRAALVAGFRDEYYGLAAVTAEAPPGGPGPAQAPLVTAGAVDWGRSGWGRRPVRFAKRSWTAPVVDLARVEAEGSPAARRWVVRTRGPKLVVATQTKVLEVAVDESGGWVPSVPVIAVVPRDAGDLWPLAAALAAPAATAWLFRRAPGAALARGALKIAARDIAELPLPTDAVAWKAATEAFRAFRDDDAPLEAFVEAAAAAYGSAPALVAWWRERLDRADRTAVIRTGPLGERPG
jgi:N-6 DNA methylase